LMQVISSESDFNDIITSLKASKRRQTGGEGRGKYEFGISTLRRRSDFLSRITAIRENLADTNEEEEDNVPRGRPSLQIDDEVR